MGLFIACVVGRCGPSRSIHCIVSDSSSQNCSERVPPAELDVQKMYTPIVPYFWHPTILDPRSRPSTRPSRKHGYYTG
jgi:hypothetical protein